MQKIAFLIQAVLLLCVVFGLLMVAFPEGVERGQRLVLRMLRLISQEQLNQPVRSADVIARRVFGAVFLVVTLFVLFSMQFQAGRIESIPTGRSAQVRASAYGLHEQIQQIVQPFAPQYPGLVVAAIAGGEREVAGFGRSNLGSDQAPNGDTVFEIGSITKVFTGILLATLIDQGKLSLDAPMISLLPPIGVQPNTKASQITLKDLVTHTSGLARLPEQTYGPVQLWELVTARDTYRHYTEAMVLDTIAKSQPSWAPGSKYDYSNLGFGVLGYILSRQAGMSYGQMVETMIAQPLGMKDTDVQLTSKQQAARAAGYRSFLHLGSLYLAQVAQPWDFPDAMVGAGGLRSTGNDMVVFLAANMGQQASSINPILEQSHKVLYAQGGDRVGMAWMHSPLPGSDRMVIWHDGETGGYSSYLGFTDDGRSGVVILSNSTKSVDPIGQAILDALAAQPGVGSGRVE